MIETLPLAIDSVTAQEREERRKLASGYLAVLGGGLVIALGGFIGSAIADPFPLAAAVVVCGAAAILYRPIAGVYLTLFLSVLGDGNVMDGYPFNINLSSPQSYLYLHDALTFTPIEIYLMLTAASWFTHLASERKWHVLGRPLLWPMVLVSALVVLGVVWGVGASGGDLRVAVFELRPLLYLAGMFILASNLLTRTIHYVRLAWVVVVAISIQNLFALKYYLALSSAERDALEGLTEHHVSLIYNWVFFLAMGLCVLRGCSRSARVLVLLAAIPSAYVFVLSQRRAAFIGLAAGFVVFAIVLLYRRRKAFFVVVPVVLVVMAGYTAAFWNASDGIGFGATAFKSVLAPGELSEKDASSDLYRQNENYNLVFTLRAEPLTGVGFGRPFYRPLPLDDTSFSVFNAYIPHNSIIWIWLKMGYVGFVVLLFTIAAALRAGTRAAMQLPTGNALAVAVAALIYVVMFVVFAYVDIAWGPSTCLFLAVCMATCVNLTRVTNTSGEDEDQDAYDSVEAVEAVDETGFRAINDLARLPVPQP